MFIKLQHHSIAIIKYWLPHKTKHRISLHGFGKIIARKRYSVKVLENQGSFTLSQSPSPLECTPLRWYTRDFPRQPSTLSKLICGVSFLCHSERSPKGAVEESHVFDGVRSFGCACALGCATLRVTKSIVLAVTRY